MVYVTLIMHPGYQFSYVQRHPQKILVYTANDQSEKPPKFFLHHVKSLEVAKKASAGNNCTVPLAVSEQYARSIAN
jgi:hypothetical protein